MYLQPDIGWDDLFGKCILTEIFADSAEQVNFAQINLGRRRVGNQLDASAE